MKFKSKATLQQKCSVPTHKLKDPQKSNKEEAHITTVTAKRQQKRRDIAASAATQRFGAHSNDRGKFIHRQISKNRASIPWPPKHDTQIRIISTEEHPPSSHGIDSIY